MTNNSVGSNARRLKNRTSVRSYVHLQLCRFAYGSGAIAVDLCAGSFADRSDMQGQCFAAVSIEAGELLRADVLLGKSAVVNFSAQISGNNPRRSA
jgi:hypothetical protein